MAAGIKRTISERGSDQPRATKMVKTEAPAQRDVNIITIVVPELQDMEAQLSRIAVSSRTPFEKRVWSMLCQIPRGRFTTYGLMSAHLASSPRAVGNALRRNPFAPEVPCHRCVATGGKLGGFKGQWPRDGEGITLDEKRLLLRAEGVRFDGAEKVLGTPFAGFV